MYFVGSIIFTKGFLLKRDVISINSTCRVDFATYWDGETHGAEGCWLHRRFDKAIVILIDALRFDFVAPLTDVKDKPYTNKLKTVHDLLHNKPKNARLYKFTADPPTTTLQRLKGLTTGSLPTFVDAGSNFASAEITEDNFIDQFVKRGKKITFLGDDTWTNLFPGRFNREYPFPSFNVKDLHTVDNGILDNIYQELRSKDWDITIGHFLGVDHCGHRYGPNHPAMSEKLKQMDDMIRNVTEQLDKNTVLFVLGDHGMTHSGDHGGDSAEELDAALFVYSPSQITASKYEPGKYKTVSQIDLVPTISLLLGTPIPFSSLGMVITDLMNHCSWSKDSHIKEVFHSIEALRVNAIQISQYVSEYMKTSSDLPRHKLLLLSERLRNAETQLQTLVTNMFTHNNADNAHERLHYLENEYKEYMEQVRQLCKEVWAKFDMTSMVLGILVLTVTLLVNIYLWLVSTSLYIEKDNGIMIIVLILSFVFVIFSIFQSFYLDDGAVSIMAFLLGVFDFVALGIIILIARNSIQKLENKSSETPAAASVLQRISRSCNGKSLDNILLVIIVLATTLTYFSNSFVVFEDDVVLYLTQTCIWFFCLKTISRILKDSRVSKEHSRNKTKSVRGDSKKTTSLSVTFILMLTLACSLSARLSSNYRTKREEQMSEEETARGTTEENPYTNKNVSYFFSAACLLVSIYLPRKWLAENGNLNSSTFATLSARYLMPLAGVVTVLYWAMQRLQSKILDSLPVWQQIFLPQVVYFIVVISLVAYVITPKLVYTLPDNQISTSGDQKDVFRKVFQYVKSKLEIENGSTNESQKEVPRVFGLGTVFSASVIFNGMILLVLLSLLLGEGLSPSVLMAVCSIFFFMELFTISVKLCRENDLLMHGLLTLLLMMANYFYGFGHQATIPAIRFETAFIGFHGDWNNKVIPATLIHCNMFAAEIFFTFLMPLLILLPCTKSTLMQFFSIFKENGDTSQWRGDFVMHENPNVFLHLLSKMHFSLYLYHGFKLTASILAATLHKRHLMVWKIFAPRFVYQAMSSFTVFGVTILVTMVLYRVNCSLGKWLTKLK